MKKILLVLIFLLCINVSASIVVMDADSGRIIYNKNKSERKLIASTTKIMTTIVALENAKLTDKLKVGKEIQTVNGSMIYVKEGESFTLNDLLHGLMLQSGNDAAMIIASKTMPYDNFIAQMNLKAHKLGMNNTTFENPHGLNDDTKNYSTAEDMSKLMRYAIKNKDFLNITSKKKYKVDNYIWYNKNKLLSDYKYLISGKIGYTKASGQVFVSAARKDNKTLIISTIDEGDKFNLHKNLYEKYFKEYERYKVLDKNTFSFKVKNKNHDHYFIKNDFNMLLTKNEIKKLKVNINLNKDNRFVDIYLDNNLIHSEKLYKLKYQSRLKKIKELLLFWK
mgnify:CR=1 FL=1